jgi:parvulin-like peptidyl-prolyl isomerase
MNTNISRHPIIRAAVLAATSVIIHARAEPGSIKAPAAPSPAAASSEAVARVGNLDVNLDEIRASLANLDVRELAAISRDPSLLNQVVRSLLVQRILLREAQAKKWERQPEVMAQIERSRQAVITESYLQSIAKPPDGWPGDAELQAAYDASKPSFLVPKQYRLAQIFIATPRAADKAAIDKAQAKLDAVKRKLAEKGADFAAIAKSESEEQASAANGGEIGWLTETQIQPEIRAQAVALAAGAQSEPIRLGDGWHILKSLEIKEAFTPTFEQLKPQLFQQLRAEKTKANSQTYLAKLLQENPVSINELALGKALIKPEK